MFRIVIPCALFLCLVASCTAQENVSEQSEESRVASSTETAKQTRPRIGVALEGGGALGFAHIGVLQWFEDHHIPVDYIAGTSMGGLVAGLYATGKSPEQLEELVSEQDWDLIIGGLTPYDDLSFRRKEDARQFQNFIRLGLKHGLSAPSGLNAGHQVSLLIDRETLPYSNLKSFDDLPIPFRCVATDLVGAKEEVFSSGPLQQALRATMSIPGVFSPVREGEKIYVDGGLLSNMPTDVVRKMGADIVIAVHLEVAPPDAKEVQSLFSVLGRSIDVVIRDNEIRGLSGADLVVNVDLRKYNSMEYDKAKTMVDLGKQAAEDKKQVLTPFSLDAAAWQEHIGQREAREKSFVPVPQFVKVEGTSPYAARRLESFLQPLVGKPIDEKTLNQLLTRLTGIGKFDSTDYRIGSLDGKEGLIVTMHERNYAPPILQLGFNVDGSESDDVTFTQLVRVTFMDVAGYRSELRTDAQFGATYSIASELYRPFTAASHWFFAPRGEASSASFKMFRKSDPQADYRVYRHDVGLDFGHSFSRFTEFRAGYEVGYFDAKLRLGEPQFSSFHGRFGDARLRLLSDHTDDPIVPHEGYRAEWNFRWFEANPGADGDFPLSEARLSYFQPVSPVASIFVQGNGGTTFDSKHVGTPQFFLGGPSGLNAYGTNELFGNQYYYFRGGYLHDLLKLPPFAGKKVYAVGAFEFGKMYGAINETRFPCDVSAGVLAETALGPLLLGGAVGDSGHAKWFFQLGHVF